MKSGENTNENKSVADLALQNFERDVSEGLIESHEKDALMFLYIEEAKKLLSAIA